MKQVRLPAPPPTACRLPPPPQTMFTLGARQGRRTASGEEKGEWRPGVVLRAYTSVADAEPVYDIMMHAGVEERAVPHARCRMVRARAS
eukprot:4843635-Pleurochrysis_carterae.AAC.1